MAAFSPKQFVSFLSSCGGEVSEDSGGFRNRNGPPLNPSAQASGNFYAEIPPFSTANYRQGCNFDL
jgi:hypothetical protein